MYGDFVIEKVKASQERTVPQWCLGYSNTCNVRESVVILIGKFMSHLFNVVQQMLDIFCDDGHFLDRCCAILSPLAS